MLDVLARLFHDVQSSKKRTGVIEPRSFINKLRVENSMHRSSLS